MFDKEDIMMIEFSWHGIEMVAIYNKNKTSLEKARKEVELYPICMGEKTIITRKNQFINVFGEKEAV